jgi:acyl-CoA reductase-like NAD-dependent aldehyde dehydrogenase
MAATSILWASTSNCGHSCLSIERIYVQESVYDEFVEKLISKAKQIKLAHPSLDDGEIGPVIAERQVEIIDDHLQDALVKGASLQSGFEKCQEKDGGYWCLPTVLTNVNHDMKVMTEETFGPILPVMSFENEEEGIRLANDTIFGLSAAVFAEDWEEAQRIGSQILHEGEKNAFKFSGIGATRMGPAAIQRFMRQQAFLRKKANIASPWWHAVR